MFRLLNLDQSLCIPTPLRLSYLEFVVNWGHSVADYNEMSCTSPEWCTIKAFYLGVDSQIGSAPREWGTGTESSSQGATHASTSACTVHVTTPKVGRCLKGYWLKDPTAGVHFSHFLVLPDK